MARGSARVSLIVPVAWLTDLGVVLLDAVVTADLTLGLRAQASGIVPEIVRGAGRR